MTDAAGTFDPFIRRNDLLVTLMRNSGAWVPDFEHGTIFLPAENRFLRPAITGDGYACVSLSYGGGFSTIVPVHRALWVMRHGIPLNRRLEVDHMNADRLDNRLSNLRLVTGSENQCNRPVQFARAERIRREAEAGERAAVLAERYGYSPRMIYHILANETYDPALFLGTAVKRYPHLQIEPMRQAPADGQWHPVVSCRGQQFVGWNA